MKTNIRMNKAMEALAAIRVLENDADYARKYHQDRYYAAVEKVRAAEKDLNNMVEPLSAAIREAEGRATARCLTARDVMFALESITKNLNIGKTLMRGIKATVCPAAQDFPRAYKYTPEATTFCAEYKPGGWVVTGIERTKCPRASQEYYIELTENAKTAILDRISRNR